MKKIISLCLLLCCIFLVSCKDKEYEELKQKYETLQKDKETIEIEKNNLQKEYNTLVEQYNSLQQHYDKINVIHNDLKQQNKQLSSKIKNSKLIGKSLVEIQEIKEQEMEELLTSVGLKLDYTKTYWTGKRSATWLGFNSIMFPCIEISLANMTKKRIDSITVEVFFGNSYGVADVTIDNVHPNHCAIFTVKPHVGKKPNSGDIRDMPDVEADIRVSINDGEKNSLGLIKVDKKYKQME